MNQYYRILGLNEQASLKEVKKAYKKLALRYHPDLNPDNVYAHQKFLEIKYAYECILNPPAIKTTKSDSPSTEEKEDPIEKAKKNKEKAEAFKKRTEEIERIQDEREFRDFLQSWIYKVYKLSLKIGVILSFIILIDIFSPPRITEYQISKIEEQVFSSAPTQYIVYVSNNKKNDYIKSLIPIPFEKRGIVQFEESKIMGANFRMRTNVYIYENMYNVVNHLLVALLFCLVIPILSILVKGPHPFYYVLAHITAIFPLIILLVILLYV